MDREQIVIGIKNTRVLEDPIAMIFEGSDWECTDGGAEIRFSRIALPKDQELIALAVSGLARERKRVILEFIDVLGVPAVEDRDSSPDDTECVGWLVNADSLK
ncbi:hypothetical protein KW794_02135 [Candidatus Saccharibacteria bacterium]|nr:hypothetical protein [Candidatus Saccharibacteria bacterium]